MRFTCKKEELDRQLQYLSRIVTVRHTLPVLSNLLLETDGKIVRISGTDLELALTTHVEAEIQQEGAFTVPAKVFQEFIHQNPDREIEIYLESNELVCKSAKVSARIPGIDPEEYPALPKVEAKHRVVLPAERLVSVLKQVVIACANDVARPVLTGVYTRIDRELVTFAATDSFRLVERSLATIPVPTPLELLIPSRSIQEVIRIVGQMTNLDDVELVVAEQQLVFRMGNVELYSRLLSGTFPKYQSIIPSTFLAHADIATAELIQALRLATVFSQSGISNILLEVTEDGTLNLASYGSQRGSTSNTLFAVLKPGFKPIRAAFNARFLLDACSAVTADHVELRFSGQTSPLVIGTEEEDYLQLVMPIRMDG